MGRGSRKTVVAPTGQTGQSKTSQEAHRRFTRTGIKLVDAAIAQSRKADFRSLGKDGRSDSQAAEDAFLESLPKTFDFRGEKARVITSMPEIGWRDDDTRFWIDLAIEYRGNMFPYNFKHGRGENADNVGGLSTIAYLLGNPIEHPLKPGTISSRNDLARIVSDVLSGKTGPEKYPNREYFCLCHDADEKGDAYADNFHTVAISQIRREDLYFNDSNGLQVNFSAAKHVEPLRTREEARRVLAEETYGFFKKLANPLEVIEDNMSAKDLGKLDKKFSS